MPAACWKLSLSIFHQDAKDMIQLKVTSSWTIKEIKEVPFSWCRGTWSQCVKEKQTFQVCMTWGDGKVLFSSGFLHRDLYILNPWKGFLFFLTNQYHGSQRVYLLSLLPFLNWKTSIRDFFHGFSWWDPVVRWNSWRGSHLDLQVLWSWLTKGLNRKIKHFPNGIVKPYPNLWPPSNCHVEHRSPFSLLIPCFFFLGGGCHQALADQSLGLTKRVAVFGGGFLCRSQSPVRHKRTKTRRTKKDLDPLESNGKSTICN